jgi:hypothetical protein
MAHVMRRVVDGVDVRKTDNTHNEQTKGHGQDSLENDTLIFAGNRQRGGVGLLHGGSPRNTSPFLADAGLLRYS